jgi:hypothetical protein
MIPATTQTRMNASARLEALPALTRQIAQAVHVGGWSREDLAHRLGVPRAEIEGHLAAERQARMAIFEATAVTGLPSHRAAAPAPRPAFPAFPALAALAALPSEISAASLLDWACAERSRLTGPVPEEAIRDLFAAGMAAQVRNAARPTVLAA